MLRASLFLALIVGVTLRCVAATSVPTRCVFLASTNADVAGWRNAGVCTKELQSMFHVKLSGGGFPSLWLPLNDACLAEVVFTSSELGRAVDNGGDIAASLEVRPTFQHVATVEPSLSVTSIPIYASDLKKGGLIEKQLHVAFENKLRGSSATTAATTFESESGGSVVAALVSWFILLSCFYGRDYLVTGIQLLMGLRAGGSKGGIKRQVVGGSR